VVLEISPNLSSILGGTYLGGSDWDAPHHIVVTPDWVYVSGYTKSLDFPTTRDLGFPRGNTDVFLTGLNFDLTPVNMDEATMPELVQDGNVVLLNLSSPGYVGYDIYTLSGRLVNAVPVGYYPAGQVRINLEHYPEGVYLVKFRIGDRIRSARVVVVR